MTYPDADEECLTDLLTSERSEESIEDACLQRSINEGMNTEPISREAVFATLDRPD